MESNTVEEAARNWISFLSDLQNARIKEARGAGSGRVNALLNKSLIGCERFFVVKRWLC